MLQRNNTFIHVCCKKSKFDKVKNALKLKYTKNFSPKKDYSQWTALHWAASGTGKAAYSACEALLLADFSSNHKARDGTTPLDLAKKRGHDNIIELLEFYSDVRISRRSTSISKKCYNISRKDGNKKIKKVKHLVPIPMPDMQPDESFQTFDQLVEKFTKVKRILCQDLSSQRVGIDHNEKDLRVLIQYLLTIYTYM